LERRERIGGVLRTATLAGRPFDVGAEAFLARRPEVPALLAELGLAAEVVHPTGAKPTIRAGGRTVGMPAGTLMGVPTASSDLHGVLSDAGLAAVAAERARPLAWQPGADASLGGLLRTRFGAEVAERLVEPLLGGVYAGRVDSLGLRATIPALAAALDRGAPSLTAAATEATTPPRTPEPHPPARESHATGRESHTTGRESHTTGRESHATGRESHTIGRESHTIGRESHNTGRESHVSAGGSSAASPGAESSGPRVAGQTVGPVFGALRGGYGDLLDALLAASGAELRLGTTVRGIERAAGGWRLLLGPATASEHLDVDAVVLAVPAPAAAALLAGTPAAALLAEIELASSVVVALAFDGVTGPDTSGVLVAADEPLSIKAATHSSSKWAHVSPDGVVRLRVSMGRFGEAAGLRVADAELVARARRDLATLHGLTAEPVDVVVQRWGGGLPQYAVGHLDRVAAIEAAVAELPGLEVIGSALHGVGVPACVDTAGKAAERIAEALVGS
jgi:oxygen-dependent protoporphyrinogen oxidase